MVKPFVTFVRRRLLIAIVGIMTAGAAYAEYPTIDMTAIKELGKQLAEIKKQVATELEQLKVLQDQINFLRDINNFINDVSNAIGSVINIKLPIPRIDKFAAQIKSDARCLMPDGIGWGIKFEDMNLGSICALVNNYRSAFFVDPAQVRSMGFNEQQLAYSTAKINRNKFFTDTVVRSLAQSDVRVKQVEELDKAADDLQADLNSARTVQDRLHVQAQAQILQARAQAGQAQILAQMLKLQAAGEMAAGLSMEAVPDGAGEVGK